MRSPIPPHLLLAALPALGLAACGGDDSAAVATVTIKTFDFQPDPIEVDAGTTITFVNQDAIDHTVTAGTRDEPTSEVFDGLLPDQGSTFELTLDEPGEYPYFCRIHPGPGMTATIIVR